VCHVDIVDAYRRDAGLPPARRGWEHIAVLRAYGDEQVEECRVCAVEWPCPAIKAITRNAARARRIRHG
jgi:hypothetical protein